MRKAGCLMRWSAQMPRRPPAIPSAKNCAAVNWTRREIEEPVAGYGSVAAVPGSAGDAGLFHRNGQHLGLFGRAFGGRTKPKRMSVKDSYEVLISEESDKLLDQDKVVQEATASVENNGIVFIDEIDKISARSERQGADVSREGVQRDLLPLIEGTTVSTKHGPVKTDHILFIASGAFHIAKPSDLLPELQGRLPIESS